VWSGSWRHRGAGRRNPPRAATVLDSSACFWVWIVQRLLGLPFGGCFTGHGPADRERRWEPGPQGPALLALSYAGEPCRCGLDRVIAR